MGSCYITQAGPELGSRDPPASASCVKGLRCTATTAFNLTLFELDCSLCRLTSKEGIPETAALGPEAEVSTGQEGDAFHSKRAWSRPRPIVSPEGPENSPHPLTEASGCLPGAQLEHIWKRGSPLLPRPKPWSRQSLFPPCLLEYREFRRCWKPRPAWELSFSRECTAGGGWRAEEGRAGLVLTLGRPKYSHGSLQAKGSTSTSAGPQDAAPALVHSSHQ
jgi:hypothetical protein